MNKYTITDFGKSVIFTLCVGLALTAFFAVQFYPMINPPVDTQTSASAEEIRMVIFFGEWTAIIDRGEFRHVEIIAELAKNNTDMVLNIDGYATDATLGEARARSLKEYLIHVGVQEEQIVTGSRNGGDYAFLHFTKK